MNLPSSNQKIHTDINHNIILKTIYSVLQTIYPTQLDETIPGRVLSFLDSSAGPVPSPKLKPFICNQSRSTPTSGPPKVSARAPAHRSYHFRGVKLKSCIKKIHHNLYISKQANVRIKHADTEGASHKKFGTDARVQ